MWHYAMKYSRVMFISVLLEQVVWQKSEIFFLAQLKDPSESGYYGLAYTISYLAIGTIPAAITGTLTPIFSSLADSNHSAKISHSYKRYFSFLNLMILPLAFGLCIISPYLLETLYGNSYLAAAPALRLLAISSAVGMYTRPSVSVIHAFNKPKVFAIANMLALPVDLGLAWRLVPVMGSQGAAVANLAAQTTAAVVIIGYTSISVGLRYDFNSISRSLISTVLCCMVAWLVVEAAATSLLIVLLAVILGAITYMVALVCLRDRPTQEIVTWMQEKAQRALSAQG
jgi:O-antigen/teichoic acid export membrane protein